MADELGDLVVNVPRQTETKLGDHDRRFDDPDRRVHERAKEAGELKGWIVHALDVVTTERLEDDGQDSKIDEVENRLDDVMKRFEDASRGND